MADNNQQQQQKGGGNNQQKATPGIQVSMGVSPSDLSKPTLSGMFTIGAAAMLGLVFINKAQGFISRRIFGMSPDDKPAIQMNPNTVVQYAKGGECSDSSLKYMAKEIFGAMSDDGKKNLLEFAQKQLSEKSSND